MRITRLRITLALAVVVASVAALGSLGGLALAAPTKAHAAGSFCPGRAVCLYADANQRGTKRTYRCKFNQHGQIAFRIRRQFPPRTLAGVSSYHATTTGLLSTIPPKAKPPTTGVGVSVARGLHNIPRWFNDRAPFLYVNC